MKEMIITSSVLILCVMLIRHFFKGKISSRLQYALWFLVAARLIMPVSTQIYLSLGSLDEFRMDLAGRLEEKFGEITGRLEEPFSFTMDMDSLAGRQMAEYILPEEITELDTADGPTSIFLAGKTGFSWMDVLRGIWYGGMGAAAVWMIAVNLRFRRKLHKERHEFLLPEQTRAGLNSKLAGFFDDAVTETEAEYGKSSVFRSMIYGIQRRLPFRRKQESGAETPDKTRRRQDKPGARQYGHRRHIKIYTAGHLVSPCLYGAPGREAIYLPESITENEDKLRHVLTHELCHKRHCDSFWSLIRSALLVFYWFHPLVWAAAVLSKRDCELACDESALILLGEQERIGYGKTLLSIITVKGRLSDFACTATTMTGTGRSMKERICRIAEKPKVLGTAVATVLVLVTAVSILVFTESPRFVGATWESGTIYVMTEDKRVMLPDTIAGISGYASAEDNRNDLVIYQVASGQEVGRFCTVTYEEAVRLVDTGRTVVPLGNYGQNARLKEYMGIIEPVHTYTPSENYLPAEDATEHHYVTPVPGEKAPFAFDGKTEWIDDGSNQSRKKPFAFDGQSEWASEEEPEQITEEAAEGVPGTDSNTEETTYLIEDDAMGSGSLYLPDGDMGENTAVYLPEEQITQVRIPLEVNTDNCYLYVPADYFKVKDRHLKEMEYINNELEMAAGQTIVTGINRGITEETFEALAEHKTMYLGDNSEVAALVSALPEPEGASYHNIELTTGEETRILQVNYRPIPEEPAQIDRDMMFFDAAMLFATIENLDECVFRIENEEGSAVDISWNRAELTTQAGVESLWKDLEGEELLDWLKELHSRVMICLFEDEQ